MIEQKGTAPVDPTESRPSESLLTRGERYLAVMDALLRRSAVSAAAAKASESEVLMRERQLAAASGGAAAKAAEADEEFQAEASALMKIGDRCEVTGRGFGLRRGQVMFVGKVPPHPKPPSLHPGPSFPP